MAWQWQTPAWQTPVDRADRVELLRLPNRSIVPAEGLPDAFWHHVSERHLLSGAEGQRVIRLFRELEPGEPALCHMPPWGLALYEQDALLFTATLCYRCSNAYIYLDQGTVLRAFDPEGPNSADLRRVLQQYLPPGE
jgi:hypothetical protein